jgi:hypothetical protein
MTQQGQGDAPITFSQGAGESVEWTAVGLVGKYRVDRVDGKPLAGGCFVLEYGDPLAVAALEAYADAARGAHYLQLARDLDAIVARMKEYGEAKRGEVWRVSQLGKVYIEKGALGGVPKPEAEPEAEPDGTPAVYPARDPDAPVATYDASGVRAEDAEQMARNLVPGWPVRIEDVRADDIRGGRLVEHLVEVAIEASDWQNQQDVAEPEHRFVRVPLAVLLELEHVAEQLRKEAT